MSLAFDSFADIERARGFVAEVAERFPCKGRAYADEAEIEKLRPPGCENKDLWNYMDYNDGETWWLADYKCRPYRCLGHFALVQTDRDDGNDDALITLAGEF